MVRLAWAFAAATLLFPASAGAQAEGLLPIFTAAGGGTERPRTGLPATAARLVPSALTALPDGRLAFAHAERPLIVGLDGRLTLLPRLPAVPIRRAPGEPPPGRPARHSSLADLAAEPDGSLLALPERGHVVLRLAPGTRSWAPAVSLEGVTGGTPEGYEGLAALPDGGVAVIGSTGVWRVSADGTATRATAPRGDAYLGPQLAVMPDGGLVFNADDRIAVSGLDGTLRQVPSRESFFGLGLAVRSDGALLRADWMLDAVRPDGSVGVLAGVRPRLGLGDGGPASRALLYAEEVAPLADGSVAVLDRAPIGGAGEPLVAPAWRVGGRRVAGYAAYENLVVRVVPGPAAARPLAAITPAAYSRVARGRVPIRSTFDGVARVTVRHDGRRVAVTESAVAAGESELRLPRRPPRGDLRLRLGVRGEAGEAVHHMALSTSRRLSVRRARRAASSLAWQHGENGGDYGWSAEVGRCRQVAARRVDCRHIRVRWEIGRRERRRCVGRFTVRLQPDGVRVLSRRGCPR